MIIAVLIAVLRFLMIAPRCLLQFQTFCCFRIRTVRSRALTWHSPLMCQPMRETSSGNSFNTIQPTGENMQAAFNAISVWVIYFHLSKHLLNQMLLSQCFSTIFKKLFFVHFSFLTSQLDHPLHWPLVPIPKSRIPFEEALKHQWIQENARSRSPIQKGFTRENAKIQGWTADARGIWLLSDISNAPISVDTVSVVDDNHNMALNSLLRRKISIIIII